MKIPSEIRLNPETIFVFEKIADYFDGKASFKRISREISVAASAVSLRLNRPKQIFEKTRGKYVESSASSS